MSDFPDSNWTFAGAEYRLIRPELASMADEPQAEDSGQWVHIPAGGNYLETDDSPGVVRWQTEILVLSDADHAIFRSKRRQFGTLTTPWGTKTARLASYSANENPSTGWYRANAQFEWSE